MVCLASANLACAVDSVKVLTGLTDVTAQTRLDEAKQVVEGSLAYRYMSQC